MGEDCCAMQIIDSDGEFKDAGLDSFIEEVKLGGCGVSYIVASIIGPQSSGKSTLMNHLFGTRFTEMDISKKRSQTTKGIWIAKCVDIEPCTLAMDMEGTDGRERGELVRPAMLKYLHSEALENFKMRLEQSLDTGEGFASSVMAHTESCLREFDQRCADALIDVAIISNCNGLEVQKKKNLEHDINVYASSERDKRLSKLKRKHEEAQAQNNVGNKLKIALTVAIVALLASYGVPKAEILGPLILQTPRALGTLEPLILRTSRTVGNLAGLIVALKKIVETYRQMRDFK